MKFVRLFVLVAAVCAVQAKDVPPPNCNPCVVQVKDVPPPNCNPCTSLAQ